MLEVTTTLDVLVPDGVVPEVLVVGGAGEGAHVGGEGGVGFSVAASEHEDSENKRRVKR